MLNPRFCAQESIERGEALLGTASVSSCYLLVEYDGQWPSTISKLLENSEIGTPAASRLNEFCRWCPEPVKVLFIKRPGKRTHKKLYIIRAGREMFASSELEVADYADVSILDLKRAYDKPELAKDILVVCTHGKRDKCCAKYGYPIFTELSKRLPACPEGFEIWESSHVGGDRFAANVIWLPYCIGFGHTQKRTDDFIQSLTRKRIPLGHMRGCSMFPSAAQYLEGRVRQEEGLDIPGGIRLVRYSEVQYMNGSVIADIQMRFSALGDEVIAAVVAIRQDETTGRVLASCNQGGSAFPRVFELLQMDRNVS